VRFIHTADWHLGRTVGEWSLIDEQRDFLEKLTNVLTESGAQALVIAGDVYDRAVPPAEAVELLDGFLWRVGAQLGVPVLMTAGNHDSPRRLSYGGDFLRRGGGYAEGVLKKEVETVTLRDEHGEVDFRLLPWVEPAEARALFPEKAIRGANSAFAAVLEENPVRPGVRSVLVTHGFFADPARAGEELRRDSETWAGGGEMIDSALLSDYCYAALGHLHSFQRAGAPNAFYSGTPLKYSASEAGDEKSVTLVELAADGSFTRTALPVKPLRDLRRVRGTLAQLLALPRTDDYIYAEVTDEAVPDMAAKLADVFPRLVGLRLLSREEEEAAALLTEAGAAKKTTEELYRDFYLSLKGEELSGGRLARLREALAETEREAGER